MKDADDPRQILVICTRQIGDVLLTTPLIHAAAERWPRASIDVLGFAGTLGMLEGNPDIRALVAVPPGSGWRHSWALIRRLWRRYDLAFVAQHTDRAHLYGWVAARTRVGQVPDEPRAWWKRRLLRHAVVLGADITHAALEKLRLIEPWARPAAVSVVAPPPQALPADVAALLAVRYVVLQVPSLVRYKQWPLAHYASLARALAADGWQVVLSGGPSERDRAAVAQVHRSAGDGPLLDLAGRLGLAQMGTLLRAAALYIGPDTSITHLAAACGVPVLALYGPIDPCLWGPWPADAPAVVPFVPHAAVQTAGNVTVMQGPPPCVPCNRAGCADRNDSPSACLETLSPEAVLAAARAVLGASPLSGASGEVSRAPAS